MKNKRKEIIKIEKVEYEIITVKLDTGGIVNYRHFSGGLKVGYEIQFSTTPSINWDKALAMGTKIIGPNIFTWNSLVDTVTEINGEES